MRHEDWRVECVGWLAIAAMFIASMLCRLSEERVREIVREEMKR